MTLQPLYIKQIISLLLVIGGLFIALSNTPVFFVKPPVAVVAAIPAPKSTGESTSSEQRIVTMSPPPEGKNWMDYGDKIVGWIVALAGPYSLVSNALLKSSTKPE
jgi:hypothetical protein